MAPGLRKAGTKVAAFTGNCPLQNRRGRLGGFAILPRCLDKGRATLAGKNGEYCFDCPLDRRFLDFVGIKAAALKKQLARGKGDGEILAWIKANAKFQRTESEIAAWTSFARTTRAGRRRVARVFQHPAPKVWSKT